MMWRFSAAFLIILLQGAVSCLPWKAFVTGKISSSMLLYLLRHHGDLIDRESRTHLMPMPTPLPMLSYCKPTFCFMHMNFSCYLWMCKGPVSRIALILLWSCKDLGTVASLSVSVFLQKQTFWTSGLGKGSHPRCLPTISRASASWFAWLGEPQLKSACFVSRRPKAICFVHQG